MFEHYNTKIEELILDNKKLHTINNNLKEELNKSNNRLIDCNVELCKIKEEFNSLNINYNKLKSLNIKLENKMKKNHIQFRNEINKQYTCIKNKKIKENDLENKLEMLKSKNYVLCKILQNIYNEFESYYEILEILDDVNFFKLMSFTN